MTTSPTIAPLVLVVDDIEDNRDLLITYLAYDGFRVDDASDGLEALAKLARRRPDLIVMDLAMPGMSGLEAIRVIKSDPRTSDIIIIALTGEPSSDDFTQVRAAGAAAVLQKPCVPKELLASIRTHLVERAETDPRTSVA